MSQESMSRDGGSVLIYWSESVRGLSSGLGVVELESGMGLGEVFDESHQHSGNLLGLFVAGAKCRFVDKIAIKSQIERALYFSC